MVARWLIVLLGIEACVWVILAWAGCALGVWGGVGAMLTVFVGPLGLRMATVAGSFAWSLMRGAQRPARLHISLWRGIRLYWKETLAYFLLFSVFQPFERYWMHRDQLNAVATIRLPLLLVHGYGCNRACWFRVRQALGRAGWRVATLNLEPASGTLDVMGAQLARRVDEVLRETGAEQLILIAHGWGGLVCRRYLAQHGDDAVRALITLGTPHQGTALAVLGVGAAAREATPGSAALSALPRTASIPWVSIYSVHDNFVMTQGPCDVAGARNVALAGIGHLHMLFSRRVLRALLRELAGV